MSLEGTGRAAGTLPRSATREFDDDEDEDDDLLEWNQDYAEALKLQDETEEARHRFVSHRLNRWRDARGLERTLTFLHFLASKRSRKAQWLMARAIEEYPEMMGIPHGVEDAERTPLTSAIQEGNVNFLRALLGVCKNDSLASYGGISSRIWKSLSEVEHSDAESHRTTCLHAAITWKPKANHRDDRLRLVETILVSAPELIQVNNIRGRTPLHLAMTEGDELTAQKIIDRAPAAAFSLRDPHGYTPLHLAVDFHRCTADRVDTVTKLLISGPGAISIPDIHGNSAFQYHTESRRKAEARGIDEARSLSEVRNKRITEATRKTGSEGVSSLDRPPQLLPTPEPELFPHHDKARGKDGAERARDLIETKNSKASNKNSAWRMPGQYLEGSEHEASLEKDDETFELVSRPKEPQGGDKARYKNLNREDKTFSNSALKSVSHPGRVFNASANRIAELLKLEYLRQMPPGLALQSLHITGQKDKELWFNFGQPREISEKEFLKLFDHLKFDAVLHSVAFPRLTLIGGTKPSLKEQHQGREDLVTFFKWLKSKGVKHIITVKVDDKDWPSHSDEAIENSLAPFRIEVLDWNKEDVCPVTIGKLGATLREIDLYWSGKNSVLRAWSEKGEGLCRLSGLEKVVLHQEKGLESPERTKKNLNDFEERLKSSTSWKNGKAPEVVRPETSSGESPTAQVESAEGNTPSRSVPHNQLNHHEWVEHMQAFAEEFKNILDLDKSQADSRLNPVTIALIDDGVDNTEPELEDVVKDGRTFADMKIDGRWIPPPYWESAKGHGTLMARLIRRVCPSAHIYSIKVGTTITDSDRLQIDPKSAAQAITHAAESGAQIICAAWTIKPPDPKDDPDDEVRRLFADAVKHAQKNNVLMLCSASDEGQHGDNNYPHAALPDYTFRVGAARWTGTSADYVDTRDISFSLPGDDVPLRNLEYKRYTQPFDVHKGSSIATALATGLVGLVYECVRMGIIHETRGLINKNDLCSVRKRPVMEFILHRYGLNKDANSKYLNIWGTLKAEALRGGKGQKTEEVSRLARMFLQK